jgi:hypothetical protein
MDWSQLDFDKLYRLYQEHHRRLRASVVSANRSHGSSHPDKTWMRELGRDEFVDLLTNPDGDPEVAERWLKRIIRGHEQEFPDLLVA